MSRRRGVAWRRTSQVASATLRRLLAHTQAASSSSPERREFHSPPLIAVPLLICCFSLNHLVDGETQQRSFTSAPCCRWPTERTGSLFLRISQRSSAAATMEARVDEVESALRVAKTSLAIALSEAAENGAAAAAARRHLVSAVGQLSLIQQALDSKLLRRGGVPRAMALSARDKARAAAADALLARHKAVVAELTHAVA